MITNAIVALLAVLSVTFLGVKTRELAYFGLDSGGDYANPMETGGSPSDPNLKTVAVSIDDDPILGDKNAPITIVEFSDYQCPFSKKHAQTTEKELIEKYVKNGTVRIVVRDLPLDYHNPLATDIAIAANCAREQKGDEGYFRFRNAVYGTDGGNMTQTTLSTQKQLDTIVASMELDMESFTACKNNPNTEKEILHDISQARLSNIVATPTFVVGTNLSSGKIAGIKLEGAQPFSEFRLWIDTQVDIENE